MKSANTLHLLLQQKTQDLLEELGMVESIDPKHSSQLQKILTQRFITVILEQVPEPQRQHLTQEYQGMSVISSDYFSSLHLTTVSAALNAAATDIKQELRDQ